MAQVLKLYSSFLTMKHRSLNQETYVGMVELSLRNGSLQQASYFLCQMDRLKIVIPRKLLDMFLDYSLSHRIFEQNKEELIFEDENAQKSPSELIKPKKKKWNNKFDDFSSSEPEYQCYFKSKDNYISRIDEIKKECTKLSVTAKPFIPKQTKFRNSDQEQSPEKKLKLNANAKDYVPKNYRLIKSKEEIENNL